jgi:hypothetical protein
MSRLLSGLAALLALLVALDVATAPQSPTRDGSAALFPRFDSALVARIGLRAADGSTLDLEREDSGFVVVDAHRFPADPWLVEGFFAALGGIGRADLVSERPERPEDYGLGAEEGLQVTLFDREGSPLAAYDQGRVIGRGGSGAGIHLRPAGADAVYRAPLVPRLAIAAEAWLDTRVARFDAGAVRGLRIEFAGQRAVEFDRDPSGSWSAERGAAPQVPIDRVLSSLGGLFLSTVDGASRTDEHGLDPALLALELTLDGEQGSDRLRLSIGSDREQLTFVTNDRWLRPWVVGVRSALLADLLEATAEVLESAELIELEAPR